MTCHDQLLPPPKMLAAQVLLAALIMSTPVTAATKVRGKLTIWQPLTIDISGPQASEGGDSNPFFDYRITVEFSSAEKIYKVPAYFAADGRAAESSATNGDVWRAHFVPPAAGEWRYRVAVRSGAGIAVDGREPGQPAKGDGESGSFVVAKDPQAAGPLRYVGERFLRYAGSGEYFLKSGADSPENLLAYVDFDGTVPQSARPVRSGEAEGTKLHRYTPHQRDWNEGDPAWKGGKGKGLVGALNYLGTQGVNSVYFLTMNVRGDGNDVWPWTESDERFRFDCSKLDQWEIVFSHMDRLGMALHVVLTETENESLFEHEEGIDFATRRKLYYRELVARFAHHQGVVWNLGEENGWDDRENKGALDEHWRKANTTSQRKQFARYLREVDPYDHPIVVHTLPGRYEEIYRPLLGDPNIDGVSLQVQLGPKIHGQTKKWIAESRKAGRQWVANLDEIGPASDGVKPDADDPDHDDVRRFALWGNLMAGGAGCEWYFGYQFAHNDLNLEDFRSREKMWQQTHHAVQFFRDHLPFWEMHSTDEFVKGDGAYCLSKEGEVYALYLPPGVAGVVDIAPGRFHLHWFNPREGGSLQHGAKREIQGSPAVNLGDPPGDGDWVGLLTRVGEE